MLVLPWLITAQSGNALHCRGQPPIKPQTRWLVSKTLGLAGIQALDRATEVCCERSNPTLQIGYLIIWSVGYGLYWEHVFKLLPNLYAAEWHM